MTLETIGWTIVNSAWQAALLAALLAVVLGASRRARPGVRYAISLATLLGTVVLPLGTVLWFSPTSPRDAVARGAHAMNARAGPAVPGPLSEYAAAESDAASGQEPEGPGLALFPPVGARVRAWVEAALPGIVMLWAAGLLLSAARLAGGLITLRRLVRDDPLVSSAALRVVTQRLLARMRIRALVTVRESASVEVPLVIGWTRPLILVPAALVSGLTPAELEALVAHELAHIRRYDILANHLQRTIETLFFFHPAVWWISARVREERENCCDDLAVHACNGDAATYASALLALEEFRDPGFATVLAASGGPLLRRVQRLVDGRAGRVELGLSWMIGTLGLFALFVSTESALAERGDRVLTVATPPRAVEDSSRGASNRDGETDRRAATDKPGAAAMGWQVVTGRTLHARWETAVNATAVARDPADFWVGYAIPASHDSRYRFHFDDSVSVLLGNERRRGRVMWRADAGVTVRVPGDPLPPAAGRWDASAIVMLVGLERTADGSLCLTRVHVASAGLPAFLRGRPVYWLGGARDAESIALLRELFALASKARQRDLVAAVGIHADSRAAVNVMAAWLADEGERKSVREESARWLAEHPTSESLAALARAARTADDRDVMAEAVEALSELEVDAATDTLVALAHDPGSDERREAAVEGLGERGSRAVRHLLALATEPGDAELQEEAVAALARAATDTSLHLVAQLALGHSRAPVRERAARAYARAAPPAQAMATLHTILDTDPDREVRLDAVRSMRRVRSVPLAVESLSALARGHENRSVRKAAVHALGDLRRHPPARSVLRELADSDHADVRARAREILDR